VKCHSTVDSFNSYGALSISSMLYFSFFTYLVLYSTQHRKDQDSYFHINSLKLMYFVFWVGSTNSCATHLLHDCNGDFARDCSPFLQSIRTWGWSKPEQEDMDPVLVDFTKEHRSRSRLSTRV
jgi:hypothetical protein